MQCSCGGLIMQPTGEPPRHAAATLAKFQVPEAEQRDVVAFVQGLKKEIVE